MSITFDSYAWIEYFSGSEKGTKVKKILDSDEQIYTPSICLMEIKSKYMKEEKVHSDRLEFVVTRSTVLDITKEAALLAAEIKQNESLPGVDALIYAVAKLSNTKLLTGDKHFYGKRNVDFLE